MRGSNKYEEQFQSLIGTVQQLFLQHFCLYYTLFFPFFNPFPSKKSVDLSFQYNVPIDAKVIVDTKRFKKVGFMGIIELGDSARKKFPFIMGAHLNPLEKEALNFRPQKRELISPIRQGGENHGASSPVFMPADLRAIFNSRKRCRQSFL